MLPPPWSLPCYSSPHSSDISMAEVDSSLVIVLHFLLLLQLCCLCTSQLGDNWALPHVDLAAAVELTLEEPSVKS